MTDLFGNPGDVPQDNDPIRDAMRKASFTGGGRDKYLQLGKGEYEIDRLVWGPSPKNGAMRMVFVLKCLKHPDPTNVGKIFEHKIKHSSNRPLTMTLEEYTKWLVYPFGAAAKAGITSDKIADLIVREYKAQFAGIIAAQALAPGMEYKGKRLIVDVYQTTKTKPDAAGVPRTNTYTNVAIDVAA